MNKQKKERKKVSGKKPVTNFQKSSFVPSQTDACLADTVGAGDISHAAIRCKVNV